MSNHATPYIEEMISLRSKWLIWTPRVLAILLLLFLLMFSFDVFEGATDPVDAAIGFVIHNIPVIILGVALAFAWKHELVGAAAFYAGGLLYIAFAASRAPTWLLGLSWSLIITVPTFLVATLFLISWKKKNES